MSYFTAPKQVENVSEKTSEKQETSVEEEAAEQNGNSLFVVVVEVKMSSSHSCSFKLIRGKVKWSVRDAATDVFEALRGPYIFTN